METVAYMLGFLVAAIAGIVLFGLAWRVASRYWELPCPARISWVMEWSLTNWWAGTQTTLDRLRLAAGQTVLEVGPGPGRLLIPVSFRVLPSGRVIGVDIQYKMIEQLEERAAKACVKNLTAIAGDATALGLSSQSVDHVILATVLGEIPDRVTALAECYRVLKPGGALSISEIMGDPHYQSRATVRRLATQAGFELKLIEGGFCSFIASFRKP